MDTLVQRTRNRFEKAVLALGRALELSALPENAERDAVLLRFELAAELMPKTLQRILSEKGASPILPKDIVRTARAAEMFDDALAIVLLGIIDDRNRMVHDYSEEFALELIARVRAMHISAFQLLLKSV